MNSDALKGRVVHHVEDRGDRAERAAEAQEQGDQAEMADRRIGEEAFDVLLEDGEIGAQHHRHHAGEADDPEPFIGSCQHGPEPRHQEHAGLDHGRRVQEGRHRRRRRHRVRQPELEGKLRALGEGAEQHQDQRRQVEFVRADEVARGQHHVEIIAADDMADEENAAEQAEAAKAGDGHRHPRAIARADVVVPVADQQEREDARQFPEDGEKDQVAGQEDAQHRPHERQEEGVEPVHRILWRHVVAGVDRDEEADPADEDGEQPGESIHPQLEVDAKGREPVQPEDRDPTAGDTRIGGDRQDQYAEGRRDRQCCMKVAQARRQQRHREAAEERQCDHPDEQGAPGHVIDDPQIMCFAISPNMVDISKVQ
jgi:hypothetical protein